MVELREFIYLDSMSVNSLLASLGEPIPEHQTQVQETTDQGGADAGMEAGINVPGMGKIGGNFNLSETQSGRDMIETGKRINDQYTFHALHEYLEEENEIIELPEERPDLEGPGDVVKIKGRVQSDPLFRLMNTVSLFSRLGDDINSEDLEPILRLYGTQIPLIIHPTENDSFDFSYGISMEESNLWVDSRREFLGTREYVVFGRVIEILSSEETWDTIDLLRIARTVLSDDTVDDMRTMLSDIMNAMGSIEQDVEMPDTEGMTADELEEDDLDTSESTFSLDVEEYNFSVEGRAIIIDPIAIYI